MAQPRDEKGRFVKKPAEKYRVTLKVGMKPYRGESYPPVVVVLILDRPPEEYDPKSLGETFQEIRTTLHESDSRVRWLQEAGAGPWYGPEQPGDWWVEEDLSRR